MGFLTRSLSATCFYLYRFLASVTLQLFLLNVQRAVGKETGLTNHIERLNNTFRQRVSRLVRESLSFSKKLNNSLWSNLVLRSWLQCRAGKNLSLTTTSISLPVFEPCPFLRQFAPTTTKLVDTLLATALDLVNSNHLRNWFTNCCYCTS